MSHPARAEGLVNMCYILVCRFMQKASQRHNDKQTREDFFRKNMYLSLYCKVSKRVTQGFTVRGSWRPNRTAIYWPPTLMAVSVVSFLFSRAAQPDAQGLNFLLSAGFLYHISNFSGLQLWLPVFTELYNSSTSTQSPTQSLQWHVWSSSSGNNCHRSLSSGTSVYECTIGFFTLSHFISQIRPHYLFRLLAIGMCHFLPVHHFGMACLLGPKVKIQHMVRVQSKCQIELSCVLMLNWFARNRTVLTFKLRT